MAGLARADGTGVGPVRKLKRLIRADGGFALPTTMLMLLAAFSVVSIGVVATANVQHGTTRDRRTKSALQLADTGVNTALLHFNRVVPTTTGGACFPIGGTVQSNGWCTASAPTTDPGGGTYTYQARVCDNTTPVPICPPASGKAPYSLEVVGIGNLGGVIRRVYVTSHSVSGVTPFADAQVKANKDINLNANAVVHAGSAANGNINLTSNNARLCGPASVGLGHQLVLADPGSYFLDSNCTMLDSSYNQGPVALPPVNQGDVRTNNYDSNFFSLDPVSGNKATACWNGRNSDGTTGSCGSRVLSVGGNSTVTLTGSKYSLCKLQMSSNSSLLAAAGTTTYLYFDSPEACGYQTDNSTDCQHDPDPQLNMSSNTRISSNDGSPVNLLFVGSANRRTLLCLSSNTDINAACVQNVIVYAPLSDVELKSNSTYCGAIAGSMVNLDSNAILSTSDIAKSFVPPGTPPHYAMDRFVDCRAAPADPPNSGC
jgi:hypothetical protein